MIGSAVSEPPPFVVVQAGGALEQAAVEVEDVARVRLAAGRAAQQERHLAVRPGVLGEVVVDAQGVLDQPCRRSSTPFSMISSPMATPEYGREVLERGGVLGAGHDDDGVLHGAVLLERGHDLGDRRELLADGHVDADQALALLVDDRVDGDGGLARLAVADDQLALAAADGDEGVDGLDAGLDRRVHALAGDDAGGDALDRAGLGGARSGPCRRAAGRAGRRRGRAGPGPTGTSTTRPVVLTVSPSLMCGRVAQDDRADGLLLQVEGHAHDAAGELEQLRREGAGQAVDLGDAVADLDDGADACASRRSRRSCSIADLMMLVISSERMAMSISGVERAPEASRLRSRSRRPRTLPSMRRSPSCTWIPPRRLGSTLWLSSTLPPVSCSRRAVSSRTSAGSSGAALMAVAVTMPCAGVVEAVELGQHGRQRVEAAPLQEQQDQVADAERGWPRP